MGFSWMSLSSDAKKGSVRPADMADEVKSLHQGEDFEFGG